MSVSYEEKEGSPQIQVTESGIQASRVLICNWSQAYALAIELLTRGGTDLPHSNWSGLGCVARRITNIKGFGKTWYETSAIASYEKAEMTVEYATPNAGGGDEPEIDPATQELCSERLEPTTEFLTLPVNDENGTELFTWASDAKKVTMEQAPGIMIKGFTYVLTIHEVDSIDSRVLTLQGSCNKYAVRARRLGWNFLAQTLLWECPILSRVTTKEGVSKWTVEYRYPYRKNTWNKYYRPETGQWEQIKKGGTVQEFITPMEW